MFLRPKHVKIMAQVDDEWSFQIEAPSDEAYVCLADWIRIITDSHTDDDEPEPPRRVGFFRTPPRRLGRNPRRHVQGRRR